MTVGNAESDAIESLEKAQPDYWCGARPCGECGDRYSCILYDPAELNAIGTLRFLAERGKKNQPRGEQSGQRKGRKAG